MAPKHQPAIVKMTLKAAAISSLTAPWSLLCLCHHCCSVPGVWSPGLRCLRVTCEALAPATADVRSRSWSPLTHPGPLAALASHHQHTRGNAAIEVGLNSFHNHLLSFKSMVYLMHWIVN